MVEHGGTELFFTFPTGPTVYLQHTSGYKFRNRSEIELNLLSKFSGSGSSVGGAAKVRRAKTSWHSGKASKTKCPRGPIPTLSLHYHIIICQIFETEIQDDPDGIKMQASRV